MRDIDVLAVAVQTPGALPPIVWGPPGAGKTSQIYQLFSALELPLEVVIASIREPSDFSGLPVPENGHGVRMEPPAWALRLKALGKGGLFFSEASCAPPATQAALLRPVFERWVGDCELPDGVKVILDANPPDQAAGGWDLALPLANRLIHLQWGAPTVDAWTDWLMGDGRATSIPRLNLDAWAREFGNAKALIAAYLKRHAGRLSEDPEKVRGRFPLAYSTPRTWECAVRLLASVRAGGWNEALIPLLQGTLGEGNGIELAAWLRENDLPDPEELIARPEKFNPDPKKPDRAYAAMLAVAECVTSTRDKHSKKDYAKRWHAAWQVLGRAIPLGKDVVVVAGRKLGDLKVRPEGGLTDPAVKRIIQEIYPVIQASGVFNN